MNLGATELIIIALVIYLLFGATRLPNAARSLGRSMRIFKSEMDEMKTDKDAKTQANAEIAGNQPAGPVNGETPEETRRRLEAQQQAQPQVQPNQQVEGNQYNPNTNGHSTNQ